MFSIPLHRFLPFLCVSAIFVLILTTWRNTGSSEEDDPPLLIFQPPITFPFYTNQRNLSINFHLWSRNPNGVDWSGITETCKSILSNPDETDSNFEEVKQWKVPYAHSDSSMAHLISNCNRFRQLIDFPDQPGSKEESDFPLAYVLVGARNAAQTVRFFRMIYQPQNAYCVTYDKKSSMDYQKVVIQLAKCFNENVFLSPEPEEIYYSHSSLLHQLVTCMDVLLKISNKIQWRYVQIVSWNDFALKTNLEFVKIFNILNGSLDMSLDPIFPSHILPYQKLSPHDILPKEERKIIPDGLTLYKGSHAASMTKQFVQFVLSNPTAGKLLDWLKYAASAEEYFWQTLAHNIHLGAPGSFPGQCIIFYEFYHKGIRKPWASRYATWYNEPEKCKGKFQSGSCLFGLGDLPELIKRPEFMVHKVYEEFEPALTVCLEHWYWERVRNPNRNLDEDY